MQARAEQSLQRGELLAAVVWAQIAADFAWHRHPGFYASQALESLLLQVAEAQEESMNGGINFSRTAALPGNCSKPRILHVVTQAYRTGGHTRLLERLILNSSDCYTHSLVATAQKSPLPDWLFSAVKASGGWYTSLSLSTPQLLKRAGSLKRLSRSWADIVFLHTHPYDTLPTLAFGGSGGPPVVLVNHADHVFWLGASVVDVVADYRLAGQAISLSRRGVRASRILPISLSEPGRGMASSLARENLGIDDDSVVLLTIASPYKYTPFGGYDFIETVTEILARNKRAILLAVGPRAEGRWLDASRRVDGRIRAMGLQDDLQKYHACADIYLDSFPFGSFTSMLETCVRGVPVIGLTNLHVPMYTNLDVTPEKSRTHVDALDEYISLLEKLIADPDFRRVKGNEDRAYMSARHLLPGWNDYLQAIMSALPESHSVGRTLELSTDMDTHDFFLAGFNALYDAHYTPTISLRKHARHFPFLTRCDLLLQSRRGADNNGQLPFKTCLGEFPRFILNRAVSLFNQNRHQNSIR